MELKKCTKCKQDLPSDKFYKNKLTKDGHSIYCVDCTKINSKMYFEKKKVKSKKQKSNLDDFIGDNDAQVDSGSDT